MLWLIDRMNDWLLAKRGYFMTTSANTRALAMPSPNVGIRIRLERFARL
jgi:hypothetical protein